MSNDGSNTSPAGSSPPKKATVHLDPAKLALARAKANQPAAPVAIRPTVPAAPVKPFPAAPPPDAWESGLHALLREHGARIYENRRLFRSFMADALAGSLQQHLLAVNTLALLVEEGLPARLIAVKADNFDEFLRQETDTLARQHPVRPEFLADALRCWVAALRPELARTISMRPTMTSSGLAPVTTAGATAASPWVNSLGMKFAPVPGTALLFSIWQTRKQDYAAYADSCSDVDASWKNVSNKGQPVSFASDHPVVCVSWDEAKAFCLWLTDKERREGRLPAGASYRLPTDWEWSVAVGLSEPRAGTPKEKDSVIQGVYPWGTQWPPSPGAGNYADITAGSVFGSNFGIIEGYWDGYATTSPVGSFSANQFGLYDLGGNVWEWCEDLYDSAQDRRILRGGSWLYNDSACLLSSCRGVIMSGIRDDEAGFRVVLVGAAGVR